jgi:hypothetical protein
VSDVPKSLQCTMECCERKAMWCGWCTIHCMGDEQHGPVDHDGQMCECEWDTVWCFIKTPRVDAFPIEVVGDYDDIISIIPMNPNHVFMFGPKDLFETFAFEASSMTRPPSFPATLDSPFGGLFGD